MILDIYKDAFEYASKDWKALLKLGFLCLLSFLIVPAFLIAGYIYRVMDNAVHGIINGKDQIPEFNEPFEMFIDGVKILIIEIAYLLVPVVAFIVFALIASQLSGILNTVVILIGCLVTFVLGIIACLMTQMGICHMAYNDGSFSKAFAVEEIKDIIADIGVFECIATYFGVIIISVVISVVVTCIIGIIFTVFGISGSILGVGGGSIILLGTFVNSLVSLFLVGPYISIFSGRSMGLLYTMQV